MAAQAMGTKKLPPPTEGRIPGYAGYIPGMKNHLIAKRYTDATRKAHECTNLLRVGQNPAGVDELVDTRPQGRDQGHFLYAPLARPLGTEEEHEEPKQLFAHVEKRRAPLNLNCTSGRVDLRTVETIVGGQHDIKGQIYKVASIPEPPYRERIIHTKKIISEEIPAGALSATKKVPGYTGHQHASQHIFGTSYGTLSQKLAAENEGVNATSKASKTLLTYADPRPVGEGLTEKHRIPGYQGYIPGKDNHIYGKTYGKATDLAPVAETVMREHGSASTLPDLVDSRPQGRIDLYAQSKEVLRMDEPQPLIVRVSYGKVDTSKNQIMGRDYKPREPVTEDMQEVMEAKHHVVGYTGHVHCHQHVFAESYGKTTRRLQTQPADKETCEDLLYFAEDRPNEKLLTGTVTLGH